MADGETREPNTTPLAFASLDELMDELQSRAEHLVIAVTMPGGLFRTRRHGPAHAVIGMAEMLRREILKKWDEVGYVSVDEDGNILPADDYGEEDDE